MKDEINEKYVVRGADINLKCSRYEEITIIIGDYSFISSHILRGLLPLDLVLWLLTLC